MVACAPRPKRLADVRDLRLVVAVHDPPDSDGARAVVFIGLGGRVPDCPSIRDDVAVKIDGRHVPIFATGGKLGDFLSRNVTCYDASFRSSAELPKKLVTIEAVDGPTRLAADFVGLGARRTIRTDGTLRAGSSATLTLDPETDEVVGTALVAFEYDDQTNAAKREVWVVEPAPREPGKPLHFVVPTTARAGRGSLSLALGDTPKLIARASRCIGASECRAEINLPRGQPSVSADIVR